MIVNSGNSVVAKLLSSFTLYHCQPSDLIPVLPIGFDEFSIEKGIDSFVDKFAVVVGVVDHTGLGEVGIEGDVHAFAIGFYFLS